MEYITIDKSAIPYKFELTLNNTTYQFTLKYNTTADFFTIDLYRNNNLIVLGEKIVYGKPLFTTSQHLGVPRNIIPYDTTEESKEVTFENLNKNVFLFILGDKNVD